MSELHPEQPEPASGARYVYALIALLALTALSLGLHFARLGRGPGAAAAVSIAGTQVSILGLALMELRESLAATRVVALVSVGFIALLCFGILGDVAFR